MKGVVRIIAFICCVYSTNGISAENFKDNQLWNDYYLYNPLSENSSFVHRIGSRMTFPFEPNDFFIHYRPSYRFKQGAFEPQIGTAIFYIDPIVGKNSVELRPWLGVKLNKTIIKPLKVVNLLRLEYRLSNAFSNQTEGTARLRYQFGLNGTLYSGESSRKMYGLATAETFFNMSHFSSFNYNLLRLNTGLGLSVNQSISMEIVYTKNIDQSGSIDFNGIYSNLFQFKLRHRLSL